MQASPFTLVKPLPPRPALLHLIHILLHTPYHSLSQVQHSANPSQVFTKTQTTYKHHSQHNGPQESIRYLPLSIHRSCPVVIHTRVYLVTRVRPNRGQGTLRPRRETDPVLQFHSHPTSLLRRSIQAMVHLLSFLHKDAQRRCWFPTPKRAHDRHH